MRLDRFADRLAADTYVDDDLVGIFESTPAEPDALWISERVFSRIVFVARAYELHTLPMLGGSDRMTLGRQQCESLLDELAFVAERLNDDVATVAAESVAAYVSGKVTSPWAEVKVSVEGPSRTQVAAVCADDTTGSMGDQGRRSFSGCVLLRRPRVARPWRRRTRSRVRTPCAGSRSRRGCARCSAGRLYPGP
jgi:hypothetical protein